MALTRIQPPAIADVREPNFRNIVINGDMAVAQRGTSTASITTENYYTVDRFNTFITTLGTWTQSQDTDVPTGSGFATSLKMDCTTADASPAAGDRLLFQQKFEGQNVQYLKKGTSDAVPITLSFWVKSVLTGTYIAELFDNDNSRQVSKSYTISSASTWEKKTITFPADTTGALSNDTGDSLILHFWLGAGTTYTSGTLNTSWAANTNANRAVGQVNLANSTSNDFWLTGVQLEAGSVATDFEVVPYGQNLERCERYCIKSGTGSTHNSVGGLGLAFSTTQVDSNFYLYLPMRTIPSLTQSGNFQVSDAAAATATTSITLTSAQSSDYNISVRSVVSSGLTQFRPYRLEAANSTTAHLLLSAEL
jgi:hypothetical protein